MKSKFFSTAKAAVFAITLAWAVTLNAQQNSPFPSYGSGPVEVRIYSDYLCPPCRQLEPSLEPLLKKLLKKKNITLTFVDVPMHGGSLLYARYYLYALNSASSADKSIHVRGVLFRAANDLESTTSEKLEELFAGRKIGYAAFNPKPVFERYNALISEDGIDTTPACVIVRNGKKEKVIGAAAITKALEGLI